MSETSFHRPIWDRGDEVDGEMFAFTVGDDWQHDRRLVPHDLRGSLAHAAGLAHVGLLSADDAASIRGGLEQLSEGFERGEWTVEPTDEDVHSAVERRLIELVGDVGKRLHLGRSRNEQVTVDVFLWLRDAIDAMGTSLQQVRAACLALGERAGDLPLPGYTHLRRAMPSSIADWSAAHARAFELDLASLGAARLRVARCPLGSGAGYGVPLELDRAFVATTLGFEGPEEPVTAVQHARGRSELDYVTALEGIALDLGKLCSDLWLFTTAEFGFVHLPVRWTTGSSMMPQKRNPDVLELARAQCRQVGADRVALLDVVRDLPSGYHRDFQLIKPPLFRAHDRIAQLLPLVARLLGDLELDADALRAAVEDPDLFATERALERAREGVPFRDAYRDESSKGQRAPVD